MSENDEDTEFLAHDVDRDRGALTKTDRELLLGQIGYESGQQLRNARYRLREHIRHSLMDIALIASFCEKDELIKVLNRQYQKTESAEEPFSGALFQLGIRLLRYFVESPERIYEDRGSDDAQWMVETYSDLEDSLEKAIRAAILRSARADGVDTLVKADVDITITHEEDFDEDEIIEKFVHGTPTQSEFMSYVAQAKIDVGRLREELLKHDEKITCILEGEEIVFGPNDDMILRRIPPEER